MTAKEAIYILRNAAWLGSNEERQKVEEAVEVVAKAIEAQDMTLYMNLPEVSAEEAVEILKRNNRIELLPSAQPDLIAKIQNGINATNANDSYSCGMRNGMRWCMSLIYDKEPLFENFPSAQPELIRCKDCKYNGECSIQYVAYADDKFFCGAGERRTG